MAKYKMGSHYNLKKIGFKDVNLNYEVIVIMDVSKKGRPLQIKFPL